MQHAAGTMQHARRRCSAQSKTASEVHVLDAALPPNRAPPRTFQSALSHKNALALGTASLRLSCAPLAAPKRATDGRIGVPLQRKCGRSGCASRPCGTSWSTTAERGRRHCSARATCDTRLATSDSQHATCDLQHASRNMHRLFRSHAPARAACGHSGIGPSAATTPGLPESFPMRFRARHPPAPSCARLPCGPLRWVLGSTSSY